MLGAPKEQGINLWTRKLHQIIIPFQSLQVVKTVNVLCYERQSHTSWGNRQVLFTYHFNKCVYFGVTSILLHLTYACDMFN
jgi:hypothetical protein